MQHLLSQKLFMKNKPTLLGPTPTKVSRNSDPDAAINGTPASPAVAFARSVLPGSRVLL